MSAPDDRSRRAALPLAERRSLLTRERGAGDRRAGASRCRNGRRDRACQIDSGYARQHRASPRTRCRRPATTTDAQLAVQSAFGRSTRVVTTERPRRRGDPRARSSRARRSRSSRPTIRRRCRSSAPQQYQPVERAGSTRRRTLDAGRPRDGGADGARAGARRRATSRRRLPRRRGMRRDRARQQQGAVRLPPQHRARTTRSPCARPTAPAPAGPARDHPDWAQLDAAARRPQRAIEKARLSRNPVAIEPGRYTVILEPQAVGDLVQLIARLRRRAQRRRRAQPVREAGRRQQDRREDRRRARHASSPIPPTRSCSAQPFDGDGLPLGRQVWIENGVLKQLVYSRFWAQKQGKHADRRADDVQDGGRHATHRRA